MAQSKSVELFEVEVIDGNGHGVVHRVYAASEADARKVIEDAVPQPAGKPEVKVHTPDDIRAREVETQKRQQSERAALRR